MTKGKEKVGTQAESVISVYLSGLKKKTMVGKGVFLTRKETRKQGQGWADP